MFANVRQCSLKLCYYLYWQKKRKIQSFSPPENERQQGVKALLLVRAQAVPSGRRKIDVKTVRRNVTLPNWLNREAEEAHINVSKVLQEALIAKLGVNKY